MCQAESGTKFMLLNFYNNFRNAYTKNQNIQKRQDPAKEIDNISYFS
jgi:hypothetical protein